MPVSTGSQSVGDQRVHTNQLKLYERSLAAQIAELVNDYGVRIRMKDGGHLFLYDGRQGTHPFKASASKPAEITRKGLAAWIEEYVPEYGKKSEAARLKPLFRCHYKPCDFRGFTPEEINQHHADEHQQEKEQTVVAATAEKAEKTAEKTAETVGSVKTKYATLGAEKGWRQHRYTHGPSEVLEVNEAGTVIRCAVKDCDYSRKYAETHFRGVHLHEAIHTGRASEMTRKGNQVKAERREQERLEAEQRTIQLKTAVKVLAAEHGFALVDAEELNGATDVASVVEENQKLRAEVSDLKSKLDIIREATGL